MVTEDIVSKAKEIFEKDTGNEFKHVECWRLLKNHAKFDPDLSQMSSLSSEKDTQEGEQSIGDGIPQGCKAAKRQRLEESHEMHIHQIIADDRQQLHSLSIEKEFWA